MKCAKGNEYVFLFLAKQYGSSEYSQQIGCIELADKLNSQLVIVEIEQHSFEMRFQYPSFEVAEAS